MNNPKDQTPTTKELIKASNLLYEDGLTGPSMRYHLRLVSERLAQLEAENEGHRNKWGGPTISGHPMMIEQVRRNNELHAEKQALEEELEGYRLVDGKNQSLWIENRKLTNENAALKLKVEKATDLLIQGCPSDALVELEK